MASTIAMEDDFVIVYVVENAAQFWSELEEVIHVPNDGSTTLLMLDSALKRFLNLSAVYHEQYLQSPLQLAHACNLLMESELFTFHSERMCEILISDVQSNTNPHAQLILYNVLLSYGRRDTNFFRSHKRWQPLIPLLMDHVLLEMDPDTEDTYIGLGSTSGGSSAPVPIPIEAKLRSLSVRMLYEVCRVQNISVQDLRVFDDSFLDYLFDLVESTRNMQDETFNYSVIKLIVALNEQFMVADLNGHHCQTPGSVRRNGTPGSAESKNRVLHLLIRRLNSSKSFGENMIFMLNRANRTAEDLCMQLQVLKILYLLFTTKGTSEYFYTNDLCVLVDVFLRELVDLDEDSDSLRHAYLRVLHPLLTKTQLRTVPYKRPQIVLTLESLIQNTTIRDINLTTKRLVERCLGGEWCVQYKTLRRDKANASRVGSPSCDSATSATYPSDNILVSVEPSMTTAIHLERSASIGKARTLKTSKSMEFKKGKIQQQQQQRSVRSPVDRIRYPSNPSSFTLDAVASSPAGVLQSTVSQTKRKTALARVEGSIVLDDRHRPSPTDSTHHPVRPPLSLPPPLPNQHQVQPITTQSTQRRPAPPTPLRRRKPPAIPINRTNGDVTITTIKSSVRSPLSTA